MENEIVLNTDELMDYVKNEVKKYDILEISYNRIFVPGEVLDINVEEEGENESLNLLLQLKGELLSDTVQLNLEEIKDEILEVRHVKNENELTVIVVEEAQ